MEAQAQPQQAASAPTQPASAPMAAASAPTGPASASQGAAPTSTATTGTLAVPNGYNAFEINLKPADKQNAWKDPSVIVPALAIIGTIFATSLQLYFGRKNLNDQMAETRRQAREDRSVEARSEILGEFIEAYKETAKMLGDLPNREEMSPKLSDELQDMNAVVNKLWLWAGVDTVHHVRELQANLNELFIDALRARDKIMWLKTALFQSEMALANAQQNVATTVPIFGATASAVQVAQDAVEMARIEVQNLRTQDRQERLNYLKWIGLRTGVLMDDMNKLMKMARTELNVEGKTEILDVQTEQVKKRVQAAIKKVEAKVAWDWEKDGGIVSS